MPAKTLPMKRPAAADAPGLVKPRAKAKPLSAKKCLEIVSRLRNSGELPASLQLLLKRLARGLAAKGRLHIGEEAGTSILGKAVRGVQRALEAQKAEALAVVEGAEVEQEARAAAQATAESKLCDLRQAVADKKAILADSAKAIEEQKEAVKAAKTAQKSAEAEVKGCESRKRQLETVEQESYEPLKESTASGANGQKRLATLRKFGRDHGFHKELLTVLPAVLRKQPDKRRTFDGLCMQQLEVEFARQAGSLDNTAREVERTAARRAGELERAQEELQAAKERQRVGTKELSEAEAALESGRQAVLDARRHARRLPADMKLAERRLSQAESRVEKFRRGPLAAYKKALPLQEAMEVAGSPADFEALDHLPRREEAGAEDHPTEEEMEEDEQPEG